MSVLNRLRSMPAVLATVGEMLASVALFLMAIGITADVLARWLVGAGSNAAVEITGYLMVAIVFLGLAPAQRAKAHIQIEVFIALLPAAWVRGIRKLNRVLFLLYAIVLAYLGWKSVSTSLLLKTTSRTALDLVVWPFQLFIPIGLVILVIVLLTEILRGSEPMQADEAVVVIHD